MVVADVTRSQLRLTLITGSDEITGQTIYKSKSFNNVKPSANAEQLFSVANALASLQSHPLHKVERNDSSEVSAA